jgi:NADH:ubiquinone oxidoreductase subunit 3 (subunit A)
LEKQRRDWSKIAKYDVLIVFVVVDVLLVLIYALAQYPIWITLGFSIVGGFMGAAIYLLASRMRRRRR